jgi:hypothetical protein
MVTVGAVTFYPREQTFSFFADQPGHILYNNFLCITYALTPYRSKVMIHGAGSPQYQGYREKSL